MMHSYKARDGTLVKLRDKSLRKDIKDISNISIPLDRNVIPRYLKSTKMQCEPTKRILRSQSKRPPAGYFCETIPDSDSDESAAKIFCEDPKTSPASTKKGKVKHKSKSSASPSPVKIAQRRSPRVSTRSPDIVADFGRESTLVDSTSMEQEKQVVVELSELETDQGQNGSVLEIIQLDDRSTDEEKNGEAEDMSTDLGNDGGKLKKITKEGLQNQGKAEIVKHDKEPQNSPNSDKQDIESACHALSLDDKLSEKNDEILNVPRPEPTPEKKKKGRGRPRKVIPKDHEKSPKTSPKDHEKSPIANPKEYATSPKASPKNHDESWKASPNSQDKCPKASPGDNGKSSKVSPGDDDKSPKESLKHRDKSSKTAPKVLPKKNGASQTLPSKIKAKEKSRKNRNGHEVPKNTSRQIAGTRKMKIKNKCMIPCALPLRGPYKIPRVVKTKSVTSVVPEYNVKAELRKLFSPDTAFRSDAIQQPEKCNAKESILKTLNEESPKVSENTNLPPNTESVINKENGKPNAGKCASRRNSIEIEIIAEICSDSPGRSPTNKNFASFSGISSITEIVDDLTASPASVESFVLTVNTMTETSAELIDEQHLKVAESMDWGEVLVLHPEDRDLYKLY